jgi:hypothetical protein
MSAGWDTLQQPKSSPIAAQGWGIKIVHILSREIRSATNKSIAEQVLPCDLISAMNKKKRDKHNLQ